MAVLDYSDLSTIVAVFRYMAPEIYQVQEYDGRKIDLWSAGVTLLVCLYGEYPWAAPTRIPSQGSFR